MEKDGFHCWQILQLGAVSYHVEGKEKVEGFVTLRGLCVLFFIVTKFMCTNSKHEIQLTGFQAGCHFAFNKSNLKGTFTS